METPPVHPATPTGFVSSPTERRWHVPHARADVWAWLNDPATFTDGQLPPYRVEFVAPDGRGGGMAPGVWTAHHGPGLLAAGVLGDVVPPAPGRTAYRDLVYAYGSYAGSLRFARPTRLQFWVDETGGGTTVRLRFDADVSRAWEPVWIAAMAVFWSGFGSALTRQVALRKGGAPASRWRRRPTLAAAGAALGVGLIASLRRR